jgi:hypothetical protein
MTDGQVPGFMARPRTPPIIDAHVHFLPEGLQEAV